MTPDEFRTAQNVVMRPPVAAALALLRRLEGAPLTPGQLARLLALLFPAVVSARAQSVRLAEVYFASLNPRGTAPSLPAVEYTPEMLGKTLRRFGLGDLEDVEKAPQAAVNAAAALGRHIDQAGREYVARASSAAGVRYARYDPFGETCAFCRLLVSRGPVYLSETTGAFQSHPLCTCVAVPVWDPNDWPGKEQADEAGELWAKVTAGKSGKEAIRAFRLAVEKPG